MNLDSILRNYPVRLEVTNLWPVYDEVAGEFGIYYRELGNKKCQKLEAAQTLDEILEKFGEMLKSRYGR